MSRGHKRSRPIVPAHAPAPEKPAQPAKGQKAESQQQQKQQQQGAKKQKYDQVNAHHNKTKQGNGNQAGKGQQNHNNKQQKQDAGQSHNQVAQQKGQKRKAQDHSNAAANNHKRQKQDEKHKGAAQQQPKQHDTKDNMSKPQQSADSKEQKTDASKVQKAQEPAVKAQESAGKVTKAKEVAAAKPAGSNWAALKAQIGATGEGAKKRAAMEKAAGKKPKAMGTNTGLTPIVALDCEMVGVGPEGKRSALARVAIVNQEGHVLMDLFVKPKEKVTDYRTKYSGVRPCDLSNPDAIELEDAQTRVADILKGRVLVGHGLSNDMTALLLDHPRKDIRDTSRYPRLMRSPGVGRKLRPRALRHLAAEELGLDIQEGEHSPVDDARAALYVYMKFKKEWEHAIKTGTINKVADNIKAARKAALAAATQLAGNAGNAAAAAAATASMSGAAVDATGAAVPTQAAAAQVLTGAQLRALRQGRNFKKVMNAAAKAGRKKTQAAAPADGPEGGSGRKGGGQGIGAAKSGGSRMLFDQDEVNEMRHSGVRVKKSALNTKALPDAMVKAAMHAGTKAGSTAKTMVQIMTRDVRSDPMADL